MHTPPEIKPMQLDHLTLPQPVAMPNGVPLYTLDGGNKGVVRLDILFKGGYAVQSKPLLAMFTNRMLREGTATLTSAEISRKLDYYGAWIDAYSSQNCNHITLCAMSKHLVPLLDVLEEMVKRPLFPQENLDIVRNNNKSYFLVNSCKVDIVSQRYFENSLWGDGHPLAHIVEACDYDAITRDDIQEYYNEVYGSCNCTIFLSGTLTPEILDAVTSHFGSAEWGSTVPVAESTVAPPLPQPGRRKAVVDGTMQSAVKMGFMAMDASHPDFDKFRFLCVLLGGYFGSRLMSNIREDNGYTYHIASEMDAYGHRNAFMISSETANEYVEPLIAEVYKELDRLLAEPIPEDEVELVRNYILGELCREYEGLSAKSEVFINAWLSGNGFDSVNRYLDEVMTVTPAELSRVAREYFKKENIIEIVAGA